MGGKKKYYYEPQIGVKPRQKFFMDASCLAILASIAIVVTSLYISQERNFHWWIDWYAATIQVATAFQRSPAEAMQQIVMSLAQERNRLYTLPLIPFILLFGHSRLVYQISLALVYLLPLTLVLGGIANQLIPVYSQTVFWSTALLTLLIPVSWIPTLIGIPDTGGALLIGLAALIYLQDIRLKRWWRIPAIGFLIALAVLCRRHFIYGGIAFLGALAVNPFLFFAAEARRNLHVAWWNLLGYGIRVGLTAAVCLTTLAVVAWNFTHSALTTDYRTLYTSWSFPFNQIVCLYASFYGWGTWAIAIAGLSLGILTRTVVLPALRFIVFLGVFSLIAWLVVLRYANVFYSLHITPLVVIGLTMFIWTIWFRLKGKSRILVLSVVGCYLACNAIVGLTPIGNFDSFFRPLFALSMPPLVRTDVSEVARAVAYLRHQAAKHEPIYVVGYQRLQFNPNMLRAAEWSIYGKRILNILAAPQVDSRDYYPVETLLQAQYVLVPVPLPTYPGNLTQVPAVGEWLPDSDVKVIKVVFDLFDRNWEIARDFKRLPVQFFLERGAVLNVYQRTRPTSLKTAVQTLHAMQQQIGRRPGGQLDWMSLGQPPERASIGRNPNGTYALGINLDGRTSSQSTSFLYLGALPERVNVSATINFSGDCAARIRSALLDDRGDEIGSAETVRSHRDPSSLAMSVQGKNRAYLLLDISNENNDAAHHCSLQIDKILVSSKE
jgi:hypothetical protein